MAPELRFRQVPGNAGGYVVRAERGYDWSKLTEPVPEKHLANVYVYRLRSHAQNFDQLDRPGADDKGAADARARWRRDARTHLLAVEELALVQETLRLLRECSDAGLGDPRLDEVRAIALSAQRLWRARLGEAGYRAHAQRERAPSREVEAQRGRRPAPAEVEEPARMVALGRFSRPMAAIAGAERERWELVGQLAWSQVASVAAAVAARAEGLVQRGGSQKAKLEALAWMASQCRRLQWQARRYVVRGFPADAGVRSR